MKNINIDRVLLASDDNENYIQFWDHVSGHYWNKFGIKSTLTYLGEKHNPRSNHYSDVIKVKSGAKWQSAWAPFWASQYYPKDMCITMGIDQIPLNANMLKYPKVDDIYYMLISNGYSASAYNWINSPNNIPCPSAFHAALGKVFHKVYNFEKTYEKEVEKIHNVSVSNNLGPPKWGADELYSLIKLREYYKNSGKIDCPGMMHIYDNKRLFSEHEDGLEGEKIWGRGPGFGFSPGTPITDLSEVLKDIPKGEYTELHSPRPFKENEETIKMISKLCPKYNK
jgi:hypothetical protein